MRVTHWLQLLALTMAATLGSIAASCSENVSPANQEAGISASEDSTCTNNATETGCLSEGCRFCRTNLTELSKFFDECPAHHEDATAPCSVSPGDAANNLSSFYDSSCATGGLGCYVGNCRLCSVVISASNTYNLCPWVTTATPSPSPATESDDCSNYAASSGLVAVSTVSEPTCNSANPRFVGCVPSTKCQLCRTSKNEGNQYLVSCKVLKDSKKTESLSQDQSLNFDTYTPNNYVELLSDQGTPDQESQEHAIEFGVTIVGTLIAIIAIAALIKVCRSREKKYDLPSTPLDGSLISAETCISKL